jgi:Tfp pilus assembly protein FimT
MVIIVVAGILAGAAVARFSAMLKMKKLDGETRALYSAIAFTRSQVLKKDYAYLMVFDAAHNSYSVYEDRNANRAADAGELVSTQALASQVAFGIPSSGGPAAGPGGTGVPSAKVEGWTPVMLFDRDRAATVDKGSVYLCAPSVKTRTYCIRMPAASRNLELWRWDGSRWLAL